MERRQFLPNFEDFSSKLVEKLNANLSRYDKRALGVDIEFNKERESTILKYDVLDAISKRGNKYRATFHWLLSPLKLDFIDDDFKETKEGLSWQGLVKNRPTTITLKFPVIDNLVYKAWAQPVGHYHAHVWWETKEK